MSEPKYDRLDAFNPPDATLRWFDAVAGSVEVHEHDDGWGVWISNGIGGHGWGGSQIALCRTQKQARLVALALQTLRVTRREGVT